MRNSIENIRNLIREAQGQIYNVYETVNFEPDNPEFQRLKRQQPPFDFEREIDRLSSLRNNLRQEYLRISRASSSIPAIYENPPPYDIAIKTP